MVYNGTLCTEAEIAIFAGENVNATGDTEANHNDLVAQAESFLVTLSKYNWVDNYSGLNEDVKRILSEYCARYTAMSLILYNMAGFTSRLEAEDMVNTCLFRMRRIEKMLGDKNYISFIIGA